MTETNQAEAFCPICDGWEYNPDTRKYERVNGGLISIRSEPPHLIPQWDIPGWIIVRLSMRQSVALKRLLGLLENGSTELLQMSNDDTELEILRYILAHRYYE